VSLARSRSLPSPPGLRSGVPVDYGAWERVSAHAEAIAVEKGASVFRQGDVPTHVYLIDEGRLQVRVEARGAGWRAGWMAVCLCVCVCVSVCLCLCVCVSVCLCLYHV
jgi:hypothetical protein